MTTKNSKIGIIITAAGSSTRIGGGTKKEYLPYKNGTVLSFCAKTFLTACEKPYQITDFIITCPVQGKQFCEDLLFKDTELQTLLKKTAVSLQVVEGGQDREQSVFNGLKTVSGNPDIVLIHDGARPFVTSELILEGINNALEFGASVPGITPTDTQKRIDENGFIVEHLQRSSLTAVQTPQCFNFAKILDAHKKCQKDSLTFTDDTEIWSKYYGAVKVFKGDVNNIKITYPQDLIKLEQ